MAFKDIRLVARYERKMVRRNKLFWIFTIGVIGGITFLQWMSQGGGYEYRPWLNVALPSSIPFYNAWMFNLLQAVIVIFVGIDYVWRDRRLETNAVFLARPVTNMSYQTGKILGIFEVCVMLNVVAMGIGMVLHGLSGENGTFRPGIYLFYLVTLTVPTLIFVLGVSLIVANTVKNHALAILSLLGLFVLFYFGTTEMARGVSDPWGRALPALFSDVTGLANPERYLLHRGMYLVFGMGLLFLSMSVMKRLPDRNRLARGTRYGGIVCLVAGIFMGAGYVGKYKGIDNRRETYREVYGKYAEQAYAHIVTHDIRFRQEGSRMHGMSELVLRNEHANRIGSLVMYLNPGLTVLSLTDAGGQPVPYKREQQAIVLGKELAPGDEMRLSVEYEGTIDEAVCYPDLSADEFHDTRLKDFSSEVHGVYRHGGDYARVGDDYTLLTSECLWYPVSVPPVNILSPLSSSYDFTLYSLSVENTGKRVAISQGEVITDGGVTRFTNTVALPRLGLCLGDYVKRNLSLDSLELELYYFPGHDFFREDCTMTGDSLKLMVGEIVTNIMEGQGENYPYRKFALVETPANFIPYLRKGRKGSEFVLPGMILVPEKIYTLYYVHVNRKNGSMAGFDIDYDKFSEEMRYLNVILSVALGEGDYNIFPMFSDSRGVLISDKYPGVGNVINYILHADDFGPLIGMAYTYEMDHPYSVEYWSGRSLPGALNDRESKLPVLLFMLDEKYKQIGVHLNALVGKREMQEFVKDFMKRHAFRSMDMKVFIQAFRERFGVDMEPVLQYYYTGKELPVLHVRDMKIERSEGEETRFIASCKVYNPSATDGVVTITGDVVRRSGSSRVVTYNYVIPAGECKEIRTWQGEDMSYEVVTNLCRNIPNNYTAAFNGESISVTNDDRTGMWDTDSAVFLRKEPGIVVDNEDEGFIVHDKQRRAKLAALFSKKEEKKYPGMYGQEVWTLTASEEFYGDIVKSAYFRIVGTGKSKVEWNVEITEPGRYEVFTHVPDVSSGRYTGVFLDGARLFYQVTSRAGSTDVELILDNEQPGWISLGIYDFAAGKYSVSLSDKGGTKVNRGEDAAEVTLEVNGESFESEYLQYVFADAIKWLPVRD